MNGEQDFVIGKPLSEAQKRILSDVIENMGHNLEIYGKHDQLKIQKHAELLILSNQYVSLAAHQAKKQLEELAQKGVTFTEAFEQAVLKKSLESFLPPPREIGTLLFQETVSPSENETLDLFDAPPLEV